MPVPVLEEAPPPATAAAAAATAPKGSKRKLADREPAGKQASGASQARSGPLHSLGACLPAYGHQLSQHTDIVTFNLALYTALPCSTRTKRTAWPHADVRVRHACTPKRCFLSVVPITCNILVEVMCTCAPHAEHRDITCHVGRPHGCPPHCAAEPSGRQPPNSPRPPLAQCREAEFLDDVCAFLTGKRGKKLTRAAFPDAQVRETLRVPLVLWSDPWIGVSFT